MRPFNIFRRQSKNSRRTARRRAQHRVHFEGLEQRMLMSATPHTFTVTNANNDGDGSLRWAIQQVNQDTKSDKIVFAIKNSLGVALNDPMIEITAALPAITRPVIIDATTQLGGRVVLDGFRAFDKIRNLPVNGLMLQGGSSTVRGMVIESFTGSGIVLSVKGGDTIVGNFLGTDKTGATAVANQTGVMISNVANNRIGGTTAADRNVISGNAYYGVEITGANAKSNIVEGNYIGTDATGTHGIGNFSAGVFVTGGATSNVIGGTTSQARNIISWNLVGVSVSGADNLVEGNYIGTDVTGLHPLGNQWGVAASNGAVIGGANYLARNIISASSQEGIDLGSGAIVENNYIGLASSGFAALPNGASGIVVDGSNNIIGAAGAGNFISGNDNANVLFESTAAGNKLQGNFIGTNATGTAVIGNEFGIFMQENASGNMIGGTTAGLGNVIVGSGVGITLTDAADNNKFQGNWVGTDAAGHHFGNGVGFDIYSNGNLIGGTVAGAGNTIAFNGTGITIEPMAVDNAILGNSIYGNTVTGIDNAFQNFPVLSSAKLKNNGSKIEIKGSLNSTPNTTFRIELFYTPAGDALGNGEGKVFLGFVTVKTNGNGNANFDVTFSAAVPVGSEITSTATELDKNNNPLSTSEFSYPVEAS